MPDFGRVSQIDASAFSSGVAYVSVRRPLLNDRAPYIFKTADYGRTWTRITSGIRSDAYVHVVREDSNRRGMLYAGTQHGVYLSYDDGAAWQLLNPGLPDVPVVDLIVEGNELVIASHGRGFWVLDNIAPLRQLTPTIASAPVALFRPPTGVRSGPGVIVSWRLEAPAQAARLEILDSAGAILRTFRIDSLTKEVRDSITKAAEGGFGRSGGGGFLPNGAGINRMAWDLRTEGATTFPGMILWGARTVGPVVPPGRYTIRAQRDGKTLERVLELTGREVDPALELVFE